ncbi:hypothetical protein BDD12DRAFT_808084 [Trichophaea hybrida]|nr:hypothetical protein BDD12DRAFT_808084 [Trichophaea hybrida]
MDNSLYPNNTKADKPTYKANLLDLPSPILYKIISEYLDGIDIHNIAYSHPLLWHYSRLLQDTRVARSPNNLTYTVNDIGTSRYEQSKTKIIHHLLVLWEQNLRLSPDIFDNFEILGGNIPTHISSRIVPDFYELLRLHGGVSSIVLDFPGAFEVLEEATLVLSLPIGHFRDLKKLTLGNGRKQFVSGLQHCRFLFSAIASMCAHSLEELNIDGNTPTPSVPLNNGYYPTYNFDVPNTTTRLLYPSFQKLQTLRIYNLRGFDDCILYWLVGCMGFDSTNPSKHGKVLVLDDTLGVTIHGLIEAIKYLGEGLEQLVVNRPMIPGYNNSKWKNYYRRKKSNISYPSSNQYSIDEYNLLFEVANKHCSNLKLSSAGQHRAKATLFYIFYIKSSFANVLSSVKSRLRLRIWRNLSSKKKFTLRDRDV